MAKSGIGIIGQIPGYNTIIDPGHIMEKHLLKDVTYIDMFPATYTLNLSIFNQIKSKIMSNTTNTGTTTNTTTDTTKKTPDQKIDVGSIYKYASGKGNTGGPLNNAAQMLRIYQSALKGMYDYLEKRWQTAYENEKSFKIVNGQRMYTDFQNLLKSEFLDTEAIRILAVNDSTFTESFGNNYEKHGAINNLSNTILNKIKGVSFGGVSLLENVQKMSYSTALETLSTISNKSSFVDILTGKLLGIEFASPQIWTSSNYNSSLSLFIKLASPSGDPLSVMKYITMPIMKLMAAGSPLTVNGVTYGMPLIWDVRAYGITRFKVGAIRSMTISRGSYETTFNHDKQPLIVDVRLNIMPLIEDFAVLYDPTEIRSKVVQRIKNVAVDLSGNSSSSGNTTTTNTTDNSKDDILSQLISSMASLFDKVINAAAKQADGLGDNFEIKDVYNSNVLGAQLPSDEIEGLFGQTADLYNERTKYTVDLPETYRFDL